MKKSIIIALLFVILVIGCKKTAISPEAAPDEPAGIDEKLKELIDDAKEIVALNETQQQQDIQTVYVPVAEASDEYAISKAYTHPCKLEKYKVLNLYCGFMTYWKKQSTLTSWYVPYSVIFFIVLVFILYFAVKLWRSR